MKEISSIKSCSNHLIGSNSTNIDIAPDERITLMTLIMVYTQYLIY
jgi:hypothetical protein